MGWVEGSQKRVNIEHAALDERRDNLDNRATKVFRRQCQQVLWHWEKGKEKTVWSWCKPRNRPATDIVGARNLSPLFFIGVDALDRLVLLALCELSQSQCHEFLHPADWRGIADVPNDCSSLRVQLLLVLEIEGTDR